MRQDDPFNNVDNPNVLFSIKDEYNSDRLFNRNEITGLDAEIEVIAVKDLSLDRGISCIDIALSLDCARENPIKDTRDISDGTYSYNMICGKDYSNNEIFPIWKYSLNHHMEACKNFNGYQ